MELLFCGTAAAEGWPALFCVCAACRGAREHGGKDIRSRAAYMLGERVRVDFGPDSNLHQQRYSLAYERLEHLIVTHSHDDHWFPRDLAYRRAGFSVVPEAPLHVWGNERVAARFVATNGDWAIYNILFHLLVPWQPIDLGGGLSATPVLADHDRGEQCINYRIELGDRAALLAHDTGWYGDATWEFLSGRPLDLLVLDCTHGAEDQGRNHLGGTWLVKVRDELARRNALAPGARVIATHFSHNGGLLHAELERYFAPHGIEVAYDGLRVNL